MSICEPMSLVMQDEIRDLARKLEQSSHGNLGDLVSSFSDLYGWSLSKVYRELDNIGRKTKRKKRSDSGISPQLRELVVDVAALKKESVRKNGKVTMSTSTAISILLNNGRDIPVSVSRIDSLLRQLKMDTKTQQKASAYQEQRSLHPNHVHLVDPSVSLLYYSPNGKQKKIKDDEVYKNKPEANEKIKKLKLWRYVMTDHFSHTIIVRYYQSPGENQKDLYDFLLYCWQKKKGIPFHGLPKILYWDKGSAMTSKAIKNACKSLEIKTIDHIAGNPQAKGSVEVANNIVECQFESRLTYEPVSSVEEINSAVEHWYNAFNQDLIKGKDCRLNRPLMDKPQVRNDLWQMIKAEQLRVLPKDITICRYLLSNDQIEKTVKENYAISCYTPVSKKAELYRVKEIPNIYAGAVVKVAPLVLENLMVLVEFEDLNGDIHHSKISPIEADDVTGFAKSAAIIGEEMKSPADSCIEQASKEMDQKSYPNMTQEEVVIARKKDVTPFNGELDAHTHLAKTDLPLFIPKQGAEISLPDFAEHIPVQLNVVAICRQLVVQVGKVEGFPFHPWVKSHYPDGIAEDQFNTLVEHLKQDLPSKDVTGLKLVAQSTHHQ